MFNYATNQNNYCYQIMLWKSLNWKFSDEIMSHHEGKKKFNKHNSKKFHQKKQFQFKKKVAKHQKVDDNVASLQSQYQSYDSKSVSSFEELPLSKETIGGLKDAGFTQPTEIQKESIVLALRGLDILGESRHIYCLSCKSLLIITCNVTL